MNVCYVYTGWSSCKVLAISCNLALPPGPHHLQCIRTLPGILVKEMGWRLREQATITCKKCRLFIHSVLPGNTPASSSCRDISYCITVVYKISTLGWGFIHLVLHMLVCLLLGMPRLPTPLYISTCRFLFVTHTYIPCGKTDIGGVSVPFWLPQLRAKMVKLYSSPCCTSYWCVRTSGVTHTERADGYSGLLMIQYWSMLSSLGGSVHVSVTLVELPLPSASAQEKEGANGATSGRAAVWN